MGARVCTGSREFQLQLGLSIGFRNTFTDPRAFGPVHMQLPQSYDSYECNSDLILLLIRLLLHFKLGLYDFMVLNTCSIDPKDLQQSITR